MSEISLPNDWQARHYQADLFNFMTDNGKNPQATDKRACEVWHRRAGKDSFSMNFTDVQCHQRIGTYWHMLPTLQQARRVVWDGIDKYGRRMIDQAFPPEIRKATNNSEMKIELKCGSVWQCVGSDNYDSLVGTNPVGVVFSEYSVADPAAWNYLRPILRENGGWAIFIFTFRGKNHGYAMSEMAKKNPNWHHSILTIEDTHYDDGTPIISVAAYDEELASGMDPLIAQQEYYCSPDAGMQGAFYTQQMNLMSKEGRIGDFPWIQERTVTTIWDLGIRDDNFIIFAQEDGAYCRIIDCMRGPGKSMGEWIRDVQRMPYIYDYHWGPHDLEQREQSTGKTRKEFAGELGFEFDVVPNISVQDGIEAARVFLGKCRINEANCQDLIDALQSYRREYDDKKQVFKERPLHDWASHGADDFRYLAIAWTDGFGRTIEDMDPYPINRHAKPKVITAFRH